MLVWGLPRRFSGEESTCQCRRCRRQGFDPWVGKIPWRRKWLSTPVFLPRESHGQRSMVGYSPWGRKESHTTKQLTLFSFIESTMITLLLQAFWSFGHETCGIPAPQPGIEFIPPHTIPYCSGSQSPSHWTAREVPEWVSITWNKKALEEGTPPPQPKRLTLPKQRRSSRGFEWQDQLSFPITFCCSSWDPAAFILHVDQGSVGCEVLSSLNTSNYIMPITKPHIFKQDMYPRIQAYQGPSSQSADQGWGRLWHFPCSRDPRCLSAIQCCLHPRFDTCLSDVFFSRLF